MRQTCRIENDFYIQTLSADLLTPVRAFLCLHRPGEEGYLLESVMDGRSQGRYSFLGFEPLETFEAGLQARLSGQEGVRELPGDPLEALKHWAKMEGGAASLPGLGGAVGYADFSAFALQEPVLEASMKGAAPVRICFARFGSGMVFDHLLQEAHIFCKHAAGLAPVATLQRLSLMVDRLEAGECHREGNIRFQLEEGPDRPRFSRNFRAAQEAIQAGDAYQVVLSEGFRGRLEGDPFEVYRRLRRLNPSPYHFYIALGGRTLVGASPEMLVRVEDGEVATVPIAGTRPRGTTPNADRALEKDLRQDAKEMAEHAMLVDLARNDLGRVCRHGSVHVPVLADVERYSHVMHLVSEVRGSLSATHSPLDALWSAFPAGTVSGAPKIRAVQILSGLEGLDRSVYGGAVGVLGPGERLEMCIAIRCLECQQGEVRFRAGAGIVADSQEELEWAEIHHKAGVLIKALDCVHSMEEDCVPEAEA